MSETIRVVDPIILNRKQREFVRACADDRYDMVLFDGAIRSGKSQVAARVIGAWALRYGGRYFVGRRTYPELKDTVVPLFVGGDGGMKPAVPQAAVKQWLKSEMVLELINGALIMFRPLENQNDEDMEQKLRGITLAGFMVDQVEELDTDQDERNIDTLMSRCSAVGTPQKGLLIANPGAETHWLHKRGVDEATRDRDIARISVTFWDNAHNMDEKTIRRYKKRKLRDPDWYERFIEGKWGAVSGKFFKGFNDAAHVVAPIDIPEHWDVVEGLDYGFAHPFVTLWMAIAPNGRHYVAAEHYRAGVSLAGNAREIKGIRRGEGLEFTGNLHPERTWADPSIWARKTEGIASVAYDLMDNGVSVVKANNDRINGWARLREYLSEDLDDEKPKLQIFATCHETIRELRNARRLRDTEDIEKKNDHALDALRYIIASRHDPPPEEAEPERELSPGEVRTARIRQRQQRLQYGEEVGLPGLA